MKRQLNIIYFAWVKERLGRAEESVELPEMVLTIADLLKFMSDKNPAFSEIVADVSKLRFALDQNFAKPADKLENAKELAIFPPVTGG